MNKINKRIRANRIVGYTRFRDHYCSHPGRHGWDLCGEPMYYWALKAAVEVKYFEKIILFTEVKEAQTRAKKLSDKFVIVPRKLEECREPEWITLDDLKTPNSRKPISDAIESWGSQKRAEFITKVTGIEYPVVVFFPASNPLLRSKSIERLIERYFEHDSAELATIVTRTSGYLFTQNLMRPEFLWPVWCELYTGRQNHPPLYRGSGAHIYTYERVGFRRTVFIEVPFEEGIDIHDKEDLELAEFYMGKRLRNAQKTKKKSKKAAKSFEPSIALEGPKG